MISSTLGAPLGGTTLGGHQVFESVASSLITPPNAGGGGGSCAPLMVVVALGEPSTPVICCAAAGAGREDEDDVQPVSVATSAHAAPSVQNPRFIRFSPSGQRRM